MALGEFEAVLESDRDNDFRKGPSHSFDEWHQRTKLTVMRRLFESYLGPGCRFMDVACGDGDGLVLAKTVRPDAGLWGMDRDVQALRRAKCRVPDAKLYAGDVYHLDRLPAARFDVVHEYGATYLLQQWDVAVGHYLRLVRPGGVLLWELPQRWSLAHLMFLLARAPQRDPTESPMRRLVRSCRPSKYAFPDDGAVAGTLNRHGYRVELLERTPIWHFYCHGPAKQALDRLSEGAGKGFYSRMDRYTERFWPRYSGLYLALRRQA